VNTTTRNESPGPRLLLPALVACIALTSCYTLVEHPRVASLDFRRPSTRAGCTPCHTREAVWSFLYPQRTALDSAPWSSLQYPWWFDSWVAPDSTGRRE